MKKHAFASAAALSAAAVILSTSFGISQEKKFTGTLKTKPHLVKLEKGVTYRITVEGVGFRPQIRFYNKNAYVHTMSMPIKFGSNTSKHLCVSNNTKEFKLFVNFDEFNKVDLDKARYTLTIERAAFNNESKTDAALKFAESKYQMATDKVYRVTVHSDSFNPLVRVLGGDRVVTTARKYYPTFRKPKDGYKVTAVVLPRSSSEHRIVVSRSDYGNKETPPLKFSVAVAAAEPLLSKKGALAATDPLYKKRFRRHYKSFTLKLKNGTNYHIDVLSKVRRSLYLQDPTGREVASGGSFQDRPARIRYRPNSSGDYKVYVTPGFDGKLGDFHLRVAAVASANGK